MSNSARQAAMMQAGLRGDGTRPRMRTGPTYPTHHGQRPSGGRAGMRIEAGARTDAGSQAKLGDIVVHIMRRLDMIEERMSAVAASVETLKESSIQESRRLADECFRIVDERLWHLQKDIGAAAAHPPARSRTMSTHAVGHSDTDVYLETPGYLVMGTGLARPPSRQSPSPSDAGIPSPERVDSQCSSDAAEETDHEGYGFTESEDGDPASPTPSELDDASAAAAAEAYADITAMATAAGSGATALVSSSVVRNSREVTLEIQGQLVQEHEV